MLRMWIVRLLVFFSLVGIGFNGFAQDISQVFRGKIVASNSFSPVEGAQIMALSIVDSSSFLASSDEDGEFIFESLPVGRYQIRVKKEGFLEYFIADFQLGSGKEAVLDFALELTEYQGDEVLITNRNEREFDRPSVHLLKVDDTKQLAASFLDPARVVASYSGVVQTDNQSNNLIIRGNSPNGVRWRLEGVDIVNPNHLPNAGTFSDQVSLSGGGQIILSTQLLSNSIFSKGAFAADYGNALSGVFDMRLRAGNNQHNEFTVQAGLIGVDLAAEGPISKESGSSFLVNYRYSFTGLLAAMGVTFGGEDIRFQDLAFNLRFPSKKFGTFTLFGMGGLSTNVFTGSREDSLIEVGKDRFDIDFSSSTLAGGITHQIALGQKSSLRSVLAVSNIATKRTSRFIEDLQAESKEVDLDRLTQRFVSFNSTFSHQFSSKAYLRTGIYLTQQTTQAESQFAPQLGDSIVFRAFEEGSTQLIQPFASLHLEPASWLSLELGLHSQYLTLNGSFSLEPRVNVLLPFTSKHQLSLAYGLHSQQQQPQIYFTRFQRDGQDVFPNRDLAFTQAHHVVLSYKYRYSEQLSFTIEPYYQQLFNVPVVPDLNRPVSALNFIEGYITDSLVNEGTGRNYGIELSMNKYLSKRFYTIISGSLYESKFTAFDGVERDSRFNGNYAAVASLGYEYDRITKRNKNKVFSANLRLIQAGGLLLQPVDEQASLAAQTTVYDDTQGFTERLDDLFRIDIGVSFKRNKANSTRSFSIDIQNLTNNQPVAFRVFDIVEQRVVDRLRFGTFPVISYRVEF